MVSCFNTASGKYYCNLDSATAVAAASLMSVSIPQAVSTIAIVVMWSLLHDTCSFNTASGKYYCNKLSQASLRMLISFNTASGKYYCNSRPYKASIHGGLKIGFGKPHTVNGQNALPFDPQGLWI